MDTGRLINKLSNCLRRRSAETQKRIHSSTKGQILNYILIESQSTRSYSATSSRNLACGLPPQPKCCKALQTADLIRREPDPADAPTQVHCLHRKSRSLPSCLPAGDYETEALLLAASPPRAGHIYADRTEKCFSNFEKTINHYRRADCPCRFDENNR